MRNNVTIRLMANYFRIRRWCKCKLLIRIILLLLTLSEYHVESDTSSQIHGTPSVPYFQSRSRHRQDRFFRRRNSQSPKDLEYIFKSKHCNGDRTKYSWRVPLITHPTTLLHASLFLHSTSRFLTHLPHRQYLLNGVAAVYIIHKIQTSEPIRRSIYFWKHAGPIVLHYKFTQWWFTINSTSREKRDIVYNKLHNRYAQPSYELILHLRGLYVKMGQILSSRPDFIPIQFIQRFTKLQDSIPAIDTATIQTTAINQLMKHCPDAYAQYESVTFDPEPLGSASIGQVHRAILQRRRNDTDGTSNEKSLSQEVAIKVMHMNAKEKFQKDFQVFRWLCRVAIPSWSTLLNAIEKHVMKEFNYINEAQNLQLVRNSIMMSPQYKNRVCIPQPIHELCCERVLVMELLHGTKLIDSIRNKLVEAFNGRADRVNEFLQKRQQEVLTGISKVDINTGSDTSSDRSIAMTTSMDTLNNSVSFFGKLKLLFLLSQCRNIIDLLVDVHGYQIFSRGVWNGDPHFGNCMKLNDGRLGLIDYGQTRHIDDIQRLQFARIIVALNEKVDTPVTVNIQHDTRQQCNITNVAHLMRMAGFSTRNNTDDETMYQYAQIIFDSDIEGVRRGFSIPQEYFKSLMDANPLVLIPDSAVFVARTSLLFRGMGNAIGTGQIQTSSRWYKHAKNALKGQQIL